MAHPEAVFALALGLGVLGQLIAAHLRTPSIVVLLAIGLLVGPEALGWIEPRALGGGLLTLVSLSVAVILFEGALNLDLRRLRREGRVIRALVTTGALATWLGAALAARGILGWPWPLAILFGAMVIVTGPTVIGPLVRSLRLRRSVATVLEAEGVLIDPIGAILAALTLEAVLAPDAGTLAATAFGLLPRLAFGAVAGAVAGWGLAWTLRTRRVVPQGLDSLVVLGTVLAVFALCNAVLSESGILAVVAAGVTLANASTRLPDELREFKGYLTEALIGLLFVLLAADVGLREMLALGAPGFATVAALALVVRPLGVFACTLGSSLSLRERAFVAWLGPRGIVAAAIASFGAASLEAHGQPGGAELRALVFLVIALSVVVLGGLGPLAARLLGVREPTPDAILLLGADSVGLALARELGSGGRRVVLLDSNPEHCRAAEEAGWPVVFGNALQESTLARAQPEHAAAVVAATSNERVNSLFVREARDRFRVPRAYVAREGGRMGIPQQALARQGILTLFDAPKDVERWNVRLRHGLAALERFRFGGPPAAPTGGAQAPSGDLFLILAVTRGGRVEPMHEGFAAQPGDEAAAALDAGHAAEALAALAAAGWRPIARNP